MTDKNVTKRKCRLCLFKMHQPSFQILSKLDTGKLFRFITKLCSEEELFLKLVRYLILVICIVRLTNINVLLLTDIPNSFRFI